MKRIPDNDRELARLALPDLEPTDTQRERTRAAIAATLAGTVAVSSAAGASSAAASSSATATSATATSAAATSAATSAAVTSAATAVTTSGASKLLLVLTAVGVVGGGTYVALDEPAPPVTQLATPAPDAPEDAVRAPDDEPSPPHAEPAPTAPPVYPSTEVAEAADVPPTPRARPRGPSLTDQAIALQRAQQLLGHDAEAALAIANREGDARLAPERLALRVLALCALGRESEARAAADRLVALAPESPARARVRRSCAAR